MGYGIPERAVMIALMALNKETLNTELKSRYRLEARGMVIQELFDQSEPTVPRQPGSLRERIRQAYHNLSSRPWDWVELRDLRAQLGDWPRREVDLELIRMFREKDVNLTLHEDRGRLTQADRDAALRLGVEDMHLISME